MPQAVEAPLVINLLLYNSTTELLSSDGCCQVLAAVLIIKAEFTQLFKDIPMRPGRVGVRRFVYINCRAWPKGYTISDPLYPPPIAQKISIHVLDLDTMTVSGPVFHGHEAFTDNDNCFFIFLHVSDAYVARWEPASCCWYLWKTCLFLCCSSLSVHLCRKCCLNTQGRRANKSFWMAPIPSPSPHLPSPPLPLSSPLLHSPSP